MLRNFILSSRYTEYLHEIPVPGAKNIKINRGILGVGSPHLEATGARSTDTKNRDSWMRKLRNLVIVLIISKGPLIFIIMARPQRLRS
jgi:hypothetical protein